MSDIKALIELVSGMTEARAMEAVNNYFSHITWSLEQCEWTQMTLTERKCFIKQLLNG